MNETPSTTASPRTGTLHDYFPSSRAPGPPDGRSFFNFPCHIRRKIYSFLNLDGRVVNLNYAPPEYFSNMKTYKFELGTALRTDSKEIMSEYTQSVSHFLHNPVEYPTIRLERRCNCIDMLSGRASPCCCLPFPSRLLFVSPRLAKEVSSIFFSANYFMICQHLPGSLSEIMSLSHTSVQLMTSLLILLNIPECSFTSISGYRPHLEHYWDRRVDASSCFHGGRQISEWKQVCNYLAFHILPDRLKLSVGCTTDNAAIAKIVNAQILRLPGLKECSIRLGDKHNKPLFCLAKETAMNAIHRSIKLRPSTFRFMDLPSELQLRVLEFTDLVTPRDLMWYIPPGSSVNKAGVSTGLYFELRKFVRCEGGGIMGGSINVYCCQDCSDIRMCYCPWFQRSFSTTCTCWRLPALFSVSHKLRDMSIALFYSRNQFILLQEEPFPETPLSIYQTELYLFLKSLPERARQYLRFVTWLFQPAAEYIIPGHISHQTWIDCVDILNRDLDITMLSLTLDFSLSQISRGLNPQRFDNIISLGGKTYAQIEKQEHGSVRLMVKIMGRHKGWKNVFVHLSFPADYAKRRLAEEEIVAPLMPKGYDAISSGKYSRRRKSNGYVEF